MSTLQLRLTQDRAQGRIITHYERRANGQNAQLDYIGSSLNTPPERRSTQICEAWNLSDHRALMASLKLPTEWGRVRREQREGIAGNRRRREMVRKLTKLETACAILHPDWPRRPWIMVCRALGLTTDAY